MESPPSGLERDKTNSPISVVSAFWKDFDLEKEKSVLDEQGLRIAENQENSQKNRRKLAESTRNFKKASPEDKSSLFNALLKGYQEEVDNLTKRAKFGENAFLNIYQKLYEAPDPYPALASVAEQDLKMSELESENRKMKVELEEFRTEATHLKNQQATIRRLEERSRQLEQQMEEKVKEIVEIKHRNLAEENQKTLEILKEREQLLQDQLQSAKESVSNMKKLHELAQNQLFELRAQSEEERAAKQAEANLLMDEVERAQTMLLGLEREKVGYFDLSYKQQMKILKIRRVGYNSIEAEDWEAATSGEEMSQMESLLLDKNRKMEHELTQLKVKLSEKTSSLETAEQKVAELSANVNEQQKLIQKLEDDISKGYSSSSKDHKGTFLDDWDLSEANRSEVNEHQNMDQRHALDQDQSSMLKVICSQRDRFRTRLRETEEEIRQLKEKIGVLTAELEKSKADNVKLYGKIRYVQDYNVEKVVSRGSKKYAEDLESGFTSDVESKYKKIYEEDINPFAAFSKKERDQRYKELGFRDRITLSSGRFLLGNKYARTFAFFYTIGLHVLVFTCLYRMSALSYLSHGSDETLVGERTIDLPRGL
ncbi:hypothetical protein TSUD_74190 [Trifolium subterraneum]|uniref:Protein CASP n=2 Tax=Trifolium TaxID=3898 RepID=A0A2Z6PFE0_TRISU|nr:hypothetical protein TSUD_74190 [Trifolium subterraneum]